MTHTKTFRLVVLAVLLLSVLPAQAINITNVNVGSGANSGNGDPLRTAFIKLNTNDAFIASELTNHTGSFTNRSGSLVLSASDSGSTPVSLATRKMVFSSFIR